MPVNSSFITRTAEIVQNISVQLSVALPLEFIRNIDLKILEQEGNAKDLLSILEDTMVKIV